MMQHYRTHMSPKSRRSQRNKAAAAAQAAEEARPRPRLHAHHRIRSDPFGVEPPLTIDQHLNNYHQSLLSPSARTERFSPTRYTQQQRQQDEQRSTSLSTSNTHTTNNSSPSSPSSTPPIPTANITATNATSSTTIPSPLSQQHHPATKNNNNNNSDMNNHNNTTTTTTTNDTLTSSSSLSPSMTRSRFGENKNPAVTRTATLNKQQRSPALNLSSPSQHQQQQQQTTAVFYQHRPLTLLSNAENPAGQGPPFPFTLLHPPVKDQELHRFNSAVRENDSQSGAKNKGDRDNNDNNNNGGGGSSNTEGGGLLQLAHVVSTFG
ncbi:hypothetical protein BDC45DRAFT_511675 [Circinella umbellata]|nr:hypothetical protein BDC45DRAFT_511675 [Circinella umbellata]